MEIKLYSESYFEDIFKVVHKTIEEIYPKYYPRSAVDYFHNYHSRENMRLKLPNEFTLVFIDNNTIFGTGSLFENDIGRFFILPEYQGKGYGKLLLKELEKNIEKDKYDNFVLASSLGAVEFYRKNNYTFNEYKTIDLTDGSYLCYLEMVKNINENYSINYDNKVFESIENSENGEVDNETIFYYRHKKDIFMGEYYGGTIRKGFLLGFVKQNGELEMNYEHINQNNEIRTGKCRSTPEILNDGRIELLEDWKWTNGNGSKGKSKVIEIKKGLKKS